MTTAASYAHFILHPWAAFFFCCSAIFNHRLIFFSRPFIKTSSYMYKHIHGSSLGSGRAGDLLASVILAPSALFPMLPSTTQLPIPKFATFITAFVVPILLSQTSPTFASVSISSLVLYHRHYSAPITCNPPFARITLLRQSFFFFPLSLVAADLGALSFSFTRALPATAASALSFKKSDRLLALTTQSTTPPGPSRLSNTIA